MPVTVPFPQQAHHREDRTHIGRGASLVSDDHFVLAASLLKVADDLTEGEGSGPPGGTRDWRRLRRPGSRPGKRRLDFDLKSRRAGFGQVGG
jgi:hypothetical protein